MNWNKLRDEFFAECVDREPLKVNLAPHNMFEWFKKRISANISKEEFVRQWMERIGVDELTYTGIKDLLNNIYETHIKNNT
jgi:hypothetical protein